MRVTRLEIFGFKSFMERLVLPLEGGVTGVVGPNGCGKSNIVDALRWVLGETRAGNLRGGTLEDVIFNGTDKLRPLGLAEVTITLRASGESFFDDLVRQSPEIELADVEIESVDKPITPIDASVQPGASAVQVEDSQGDEETPRVPHLRVLPSAALQASDAAPRASAAEASSEGESSPEESQAQDAAQEVGGQEAATGEKESTEGGGATRVPSGLGRFSWLKSVSEVQVTRRLYRSGESEFFINRVACRLRDIKELLRAVGLSARAYTIVAQGEVGRIVTAKPEERRHIIEDAAGVLGLRDRISAANRRLEETATNISRLDDIIREVTRQVNSLKRQATIARTREELKAQIRSLESKLFATRLFEGRERVEKINSQLTAARTRAEDAERAVERCQVEEQAARGELIGVDVKGDEVRLKLDQLREELNARARQRSERSARLGEIRAFGLARETEIRRLEERQTTLQQRREEAEQETASLAEEERRLAEQLQSVEAVGDDELRNLTQELYQLREQLKKREQVVRENRDKLVAAQSRAEALQQQIVSASPVHQLRKTMGEEGKDFLSGLAAEAKPFIDELKVPPQLARAVQAVLGERAEFLVSADPHATAQRFVERAYQRDPMNKRGLALGLFKRDAESEPTSPPAELGGLRPLLAELSTGESVRSVAARIFGDVYYAESLEAATAFFAKSDGATRKGVTVVTLEGDILTEFSFYSFRHEGGIIQLKNRLEELQRTVHELSAQQDALAAEREALQQRISDTEQRHAQALRESQARQAKMRELTNQLGNVRGRLHAGRRLQEQIEQDMNRAVQQVNDARRKIEELRGEEQRLEQEVASLATDVDEQLKQQIRTLNEEYAQVEAVRRKGREQLAQFANALHAARQELDRARSALSSLSLDEQRVVLELGNVRERILVDYGEEFVQEIEASLSPESRMSDQAKAEASAEVQRLRARIQREGEVDPTSIERFEEESRRLQDLEGQKRDLEQAAATLRSTIGRLVETSVNRFVETFTAVRDNFARLVPQLFGGGKASLELTDPDNPLDSGVEIFVRPPGKKPKSLELLSGGEKALCATALIFSMFLVRPSPLCVLDEVDAPLDEANLMRFLTLIKEMSSRVQFLMITHNKNSMSVADNLVGVTMQEPGASKVISVSLQEAYSQVA